MTVIGVQNLLSAAIARQAKPVALGSAASVPVPSSVTSSVAAEAASSSSISPQSLNTAGLTGAAANVAQLSSVLQVTSGGVTDVQSLLQQLQDLAGQPAAGTEVSSATLAKLNSQFQQVLAQINRIVSTTTFNGASVLDGTFSSQQLSGVAADVQGAPSAVIDLPDLTTTTLFNGAEPNLLTQESAAQAFALVGSAKDSVNKAGDDLKASQAQLEFASAGLQTALTNVDAAQATLSESDLAGVFENLLGGLANEPVNAAQLQAGNLSPALLSLLKE